MSSLLIHKIWLLFHLWIWSIYVVLEDIVYFKITLQRILVFYHKFNWSDNKFKTKSLLGYKRC